LCEQASLTAEYASDFPIPTKKRSLFVSYNEAGTAKHAIPF
jgi:hypothetical protein